MPEAVWRNLIWWKGDTSLKDEGHRCAEELAVILLQAAPGSDPAMEVLREFDQDRCERLEVGAGELQRVVGQVLLSPGQTPRERILDSGKVVLQRTPEALRSKRQLRHRTSFSDRDSLRSPPLP